MPAALAAGNTVVLKTAEDAPLTILLLAEIAHRVPAAGRAERGHRQGPGGRRGAAASIPAWTRCRSPGRPRSAGTSRSRRRAIGARLAGTGREEPEHRLSGRGDAGEHRRHRRRRADRDAVHPAGTVLHRRVPAVRARGRLRRGPGRAGREGVGAGGRRPARRGHRHGLDHQRDAVRIRARLRRGRKAAARACSVPLDGTEFAGEGLDGFYTGPDHLRRRRQQLADRPGGDLRAGAGGDSRGRIATTSSRWPTTRITASPPTSGRTT